MKRLNRSHLHFKSITIALGLGSSLFASSGFAQSSGMPPLTQTTPSSTDDKTSTDQEGWKPLGVISGQFNWDQNQDVVGQTNGHGQKYGLNLGLGVKYKKDENRWTNKLDSTVGYTRTPVLPRYVKSVDILKFVSMYTYSFELPPPVGPYVRFSFDTNMFDGRQETAGQKNYLITNSDGTTETRNTDSLLLSRGFQPVTTRESIGGFITLANKKELSSTGRLGFGLEQFAGAKSVLSIDDNNDTEQIEVSTLKNYNIGGLEGGLILESYLAESTRLSAEGEFLYPFIIKDDIKGDKKDMELLNWEVKAKLSTQALSWLSAIYEFKARKQPFVQTKVQIQQNFGLQAFYTFL